MIGLVSIAQAQTPRPTPPSSPASLDSLRAVIQQRVADVPGLVVGVAFHDLARGDTLYLTADSTFHAASTMKVPVMIELFRRIDAGALRLDQTVLLKNQFSSIVDGSPFSLDPAADSDSVVYTLIGTQVPIRDLMEHMITRSSNLATNMLIEMIGAPSADSTAHRLGARKMQVLRGVEDSKAFQAGKNNTTTARDLATLMAAIERNVATSPTSAAEMRAILLRQEFNREIPAGVPPGTPVAHKTGSITGVLHDAAIVYPNGRAPYVLVLLTRGASQPALARAAMVDISRLVYAHATRR
jgi:beta-lactamase class A